jgi:glycine/D-amino acid oxidase-like deaminating enzyme
VEQYDVVIIGAGIMGLLSAYKICEDGGRVAVLEKSAIGNSSAGSSGLTRSLRSDYENSKYSLLAKKSWDKWLNLEDALGQQLVIKTGCLNLSTTNSVTSYAIKAASWLKRDKAGCREFKKTELLNEEFPQFRNLKYGVFEYSAGVGLASKAVDLLTKKLRSNSKCQITEDISVKSIICTPNSVQIKTNKAEIKCQKLILTAGIGTSSLIDFIEGSKYKLNLIADRPSESVYYIPQNPEPYLSKNLPIFANLDFGIYGHPVFDGITSGVKIGMYSPPESVNREFKNTNGTIGDFVAKFMPDLAQASRIKKIADTDQCVYDMTEDSNFIVGVLPEFQNIFIATGFCGTGYKFAPVVAEAITDFAFSRKVRYDISAFDPNRFNLTYNHE